MVNSWKMWCRLCANEGPNINLFPPQSDFTNALYNFFSINLSDENNWGNMICFNCHETVKQFIEFGNKVSRVQKMFLEILNGDGEPNTLQLKTEYELDDELDQKPIGITSINKLYEPQINVFNNSTDQATDLIESSNIKLGTTSSEDYSHKAEKDCTNKEVLLQNEQYIIKVFKSEPDMNEPSKDPNDCKQNTVQEKQNNTTSAIRCSKCIKTFPTVKSMKCHFKRQHGLTKRIYKIKDPFICEKCGKICKSQGRLDGHKLVHVEERPFKCRQCEKTFKSKPRLKYHEDTHSTTSYICIICGIRLNSKATLNKHMVVHSDEKVHKCDYCGNVYKRAKALKTHLILHTGLRPYNCDFCNRTFANGSNCRSHKKKSHPVELAAMEAAGKISNYTKVPELKDLRALMISPKETQNDTTLN